MGCWQALERAVEAVCRDAVGRLKELGVAVGWTEAREDPQVLCTSRKTVETCTGSATIECAKLLEESGLTLCKCIYRDEWSEKTEYMIFTALSNWGIDIVLVRKDLIATPHTADPCTHLKKWVLESAKKSNTFKKWLQSPLCDPQGFVEKLRSEITSVARLLPEEKRKELAEELNKIAEKLKHSN